MCALHTSDEYKGGDLVAEILTSVFTIWYSFPLFTAWELFDFTYNSKYDDVLKVVFIVILFFNIILNFLLSYWLFRKINWFFKSLIL